MNYDTDDMIVCCARVAGRDPATIAAGSTQSECAQCHAAIWVAPSSSRLIVLHPDILLLCVVCAMAKAENEPDIELGIIPDSMQELAKHFAKK